MKHNRNLLASSGTLLLAVFLAAACSPAAPEPAADVHDHDAENQTADTGEAYLTHPEELSAVQLPADGKLRVVATTTILADVVANVGGETIELTGLFPLGSDPHTFEAAPDDLQAMTDADVIFINGVGLEEFLEPSLEQAAADTPVVSVSEHIDLLSFGSSENETGEDHEAASDDEHAPQEADAGHDHSGTDPHVWFDPNNVKLWVATIVETLSTLDPAQAAEYQANGDAYIQQLAELDSWIQAETSAIPEENRELVTDHTAFSYFARRYGFTMVGAVIPAYSTSAEPSAQELAALEDAISEMDVKALFVGVSANTALAEQASRDTGVPLLPLYTGSLSDSSGPAATYLDLMRYNTGAIVEGLAGS